MRVTFALAFSFFCLTLFSVHAQNVAAPVAAQSASVQWLDDFSAAKSVAAEKQLPILMYFTGSDWCGWCVKLHKEVFDQKAFQEYAEKQLVLLKIDFPRNIELSKELQERNLQLRQQFNVRGFPTIYLVDAEGKTLGQTGYRPGGAEEYVKHLQKLLKKN